MWKLILRVLAQGRRSTVVDQIEFIDRGTVIRDSRFNVFAQLEVV